jgi:SAM-dependent methyltransferase
MCGGSFSSFRKAEGAFYYFCPSCLAYFLWPPPPQAAWAKYYEIMHGNYGQEGRSYDDLSRRLAKDFRAKRRLIARFVDLHDQGSRLLDYGCAYGSFLAALGQDAIQKHGCDVSGPALEVARARLGGKVRWLGPPGDYPEEVRGGFRCITLWATIEHLPNPIGTLEELAGILCSGGYIALDTGLSNEWESKWLKGNVQWFDAPQHLWVFTAAGMRQALDRAGYDLAYEDLHYDYALSRRLGRFFLSLGMAAATRALNRVVNLEDRKIPFGHTGLWIAKKR